MHACVHSPLRHSAWCRRGTPCAAACLPAARRRLQPHLDGQPLQPWQSTTTNDLPLSAHAIPHGCTPSRRPRRWATPHPLARTRTSTSTLWPLCTKTVSGVPRTLQRSAFLVEPSRASVRSRPPPAPLSFRPRHVPCSPRAVALSGLHSLTAYGHAAVKGLHGRASGSPGG